MEWSHTHFDGYELLALPSDSPASIIILDSSALVLVQRVLLPEGDAPPKALTWQPGGANNGCSSGALSCIVSSRGRAPELAVFTPNGVHLSSRVRYSWSCTARVPLSPLHKASCDRILLSWSCRGPLVVADQAISVWSNNSTVPNANANTFSSDESGSSDSSDDDSSGEEGVPSVNRESSSTFGPRSVYRNSLRLSRKWVRKEMSERPSDNSPSSSNVVALATSPCGCMFAAACEGSEDVTVWLRRKNIPRLGKAWQTYDRRRNGRKSRNGSTLLSASRAGRTGGCGFGEQGQDGEGPWNFQPATVLNCSRPLVQVVWGRGPGAQRDYLLTLGEDGSAHIWVEQQWEDRFSVPTETGSVKFFKTATINSWYGDNLRLKSVGFVKWAYFGSHSRDLVSDKGSASESAYHLVHQQEQAADEGARPYRSDNWIIGCGDDGRRFLWSVKDMPLPDGRTIPEPVEVASLPFSWLGGLSGGTSAAAAAAAAASQSQAAAPQISAVGYYDAQSADGAPTEVQVVARAAECNVAVITARVHRANARSRYLLRNTRSVVLPLGQAAADESPGGLAIRNGQQVNGVSPQKWKKRTKTQSNEGVFHPNLPLLARLSKSENKHNEEGGLVVEIHSWVNGGSHLQCIPCKPEGNGKGPFGHTGGAEPKGADENGAWEVTVSHDFVIDDSSDSDANGKDRVAPVFGKLAEKVRAGDELSFVPYALPSLTLVSSPCHEDTSSLASPSDDSGCDRGIAGGQDQGYIKHVMWMSDWIGAEALSPALAVIDGQSRLHVFELDDGASSNEFSSATDGRSGSAHGGVSSTEGVDKYNLNGVLRKRAPARSPTGSVVSLTNSSSLLHMKGLLDEDVKENEQSSSPERMSRRARAEFGRLSSDEEFTPVEKTVVLPLDSKYGLGLTLAFEGNRVEVSTFVKHPDTSEMLPAEASGRIRPGDQLVDINGHGVEGLNAEEATALIRQARRDSMEGGAVSLELTFREATPASGTTTPVRSVSRSGSPGPRSGWYKRKSRMRRSGRGSAKGSTAAGWANTDAEQHALRWNPIGNDEVPAFKACTLLPWLGGSVAIATGNGSGAGTLDGVSSLPVGFGRWSELGVYPPGDYRRRREALLLGFQPSQMSPLRSGGEGYVVAMLVQAAPQGGLSVAEVCRAPLGPQELPVSFNKEKTPTGAPTTGRATTEAVCEDGWVRRWCVTRGPPGGSKERVTFTLTKIDICKPFQGPDGEEPGRSSSLSPATLIAVASPTLLAVARRGPMPAQPFHDGSSRPGAVSAAPERPPVLEVWSCAKTPYPRCPFKKDGSTVLPGCRPGQVVEGMCWVSPETGDDRGAAVSGYGLCLSVGGTVTVLAKKRLQHAPVSPGVVHTAGGGEGYAWSPVFRVANPSSLLICRTAGLRDFCQGLMAKCQRHHALSLVRTRAMKRLPASAKEITQGTAHGSDSATSASPHSQVSPLPLLRDEIDGLRCATQEGRSLEDWHPESLVSLWCTSLMLGGEDREGAGWEKGRQRTLSVFRWVISESSELGTGGVTAGAVVPFLAKGGNVLNSSKSVAGDLGGLKTCFAKYLKNRLEEEIPQGGQKVASTDRRHGSTSASVGRRFLHAGPRHSSESTPTRCEETPASARDIADMAAAAGVPRRLLNLSGSELSSLSALLDVALGNDASTSSFEPPAQSVRAAAPDTAAALFSRGSQLRPASSSSPLKSFRSTESRSTAVIATTSHMDDYANVFLLAHGLWTHLGKNGDSGKGGGVEDSKLCVASSAALAMLLAPDDTQREVLEIVCPKPGGGVAAPGNALTWSNASAMLLPLWIRDASELQRVAETVASATFLRDRDLMAAAMFFAALGQEKKLLALAKTDRGFVGQRDISGGEGDINTSSGRSQGATQGQRLEKLLAHDFSSPRGRSVAEKNAYILLRKRKFKSAAAVFLLPRPAMLKEALQVILMHVKDIQLAFVLARLVEIRDGGGVSPTARGAGTLGGFGGIGGLGGGGGGGGGFGARGRGTFAGGFGSMLGTGGGGGGDRAASNIGDVNAASTYKSIGGASRKLLRDEFLPLFDGESVRPITGNTRQQSSRVTSSPLPTVLKRNPFLECVTLFWLGQSDRALRALCRVSAAEQDASVGVSGTTLPKGVSTLRTDGAAGLGLCNRAIDVATRPFLVSKLQQCERSSKPIHEGASRSSMASGGGGKDVSANGQRLLLNAQLAGAVRLSTVEYLASNGMEISALEVLGNNAGGNWTADLATQQIADVTRVDAEMKVATGTVRGGVDPAGGSPDGLLSVFQGPPSESLAQRKGVAPSMATSGEPSSGMFDRFGGPSTRTVATSAAASPTAVASGELSGDMFGGFDGPPRMGQKPPALTTNPTASGELSGDMFGAFDAAPQQRKTKQTPSGANAAATASGELSGDMFGAFDAAPQQRKAKQTPSAAKAAVTASGELSGDMFGAFDAAPQQRKTKPIPSEANAAVTASGELSGDMFGAFDAAPQQRKAKPIPSGANAAATASGELSGDMFGAFDAAPPQRMTKAAAGSATTPGKRAEDLRGGFDSPKKSSSASVENQTTRGKPRLSSPVAVTTGELSSDLFSSFDGPPRGITRDGEGVSSPMSEIWHEDGRHPALSPGGGSSRASPRSSSYGYFEGEEPSWESYDKHVAWQDGLGWSDGDDGLKGHTGMEKHADEDVGIPFKAPEASSIHVRKQWDVWAEDLAYEAATKRLLRELRHLFNGLDAMAPTVPNMAFALGSLGASTSPQGTSPDVAERSLLESVGAAAEGLCEAHGLSARALTAAAAGALCHASAGGSRRLGALCLLLNALDRPVAADAAVCAAARRLVQCCNAHGEAQLEDLSLGAAHARAVGTETEAAIEEAKVKALGDTDVAGDDGGDGGNANTFHLRESKVPEGSSVSVAAATAGLRAEATKTAEAEAAEATGGLGLENLRPHLSELRATAFQLELCLALHARGCLRLSSRARAEAAVGFRAGLLMESLGRRYDVIEALVAHPPASMRMEKRHRSGTEEVEDALSLGSVEGTGGEHEAGAWPDTPNANLLNALSRLHRPDFEIKGLEPWESSLTVPPTNGEEEVKRPGISDTSQDPTEQTLRETLELGMAASGAAPCSTGESKTQELVERDPFQERLQLVRLTDSLSRGVWPTYARLACALNLLTLRAMHTQLCGSLATLTWREDYRARPPLAARVCGAVPFHPTGEGGVALGSERKAGVYGGVGDGSISGGIVGDRGGEVAPSPSSTFYSAFLHSLYVWAQCLDRQFYAQAHRPRIPPAHHLLPLSRGRPVSVDTLSERAAGTAPTALVSSSAAALPAPSGGSGSLWQDRKGTKGTGQPERSSQPLSDGASKGGRATENHHESSAMASSGASRRWECCPYLFQRGMVVSEEGVRGGQDHLRSDEAWPEEDSEDSISYQMLHGMRMPDGSALASVPLHAVREGGAGDTHFVEAFYASDARSWLMRSGVNPAGPSAGARVRKWEKMGIVQRVRKAEWAGAQIHFRSNHHNGDTLLRFVDRWDVEHCGESAGAALRAGPLGRVSYQLVPAGRSAPSRETLYGKLLHAIGGGAASELWTRLGVEDWLVRTVARAEFPFSYRHQRAELPSNRGADAGVGRVVAVGAAPQTPAAAAAAAADLPCTQHDGDRPERDPFCLCVFEHLCRNALFRRLRLPHRFQALVTVQLLGLKNLSPHYHPSKTDVFAAVTLKRLDPPPAAGNDGHSGGESAAKRRGRNTSVTAVKRLLPTANGQASQQSRWGAKAAFRFPLPEEASRYVLAYGYRAYELVMEGYNNGADGGGARKGLGSQGPPRCVRIAVWRKQFLADQRLGEVDVPLGKLDDRGDVDEWVGLRGDKGSSWFVNVRFNLRFVMVSVSDPVPDEDSEDIIDVADKDPEITLSFALGDVDIM